MTHKKIKLRLSSLDHAPDGVLINIFIREARRAAWTEDEVNEVKSAAISADHTHLMKILTDHCEDPMNEDDVYDHKSHLEDQMNSIIDKFEETSYDESFEFFEDFDDYNEDKDEHPCNYCARPDSDCQNCPDRY